MIAAGYTDITYDDCDKKFRNMKMTFKKLLLRNYNEGTKVRWEYFHTFKDIMSAEEVPSSVNLKNLQFLEEEEQFTEQADPLQTKVSMKMWTERATNYLVKVIEKNLHHYRNPGVKRGDFWKRVAKSMTMAGFKDITYDNCDVKFRNMKKTFLTLVNKIRAGEKRTGWKYFDAFARILPKEADGVSMPTYIKNEEDECSDEPEESKYEDGTVDDLSEKSYVCKEVIVDVPSSEGHYMLGNDIMEVEELEFEEDDEEEEERILIKTLKVPHKSGRVKVEECTQESLKRKRMCKENKRVVVPVIERRKLAELQSIKCMIQKLSKLQQENNQIQKERNRILSRLVEKMGKD